MNGWVNRDERERRRREIAIGTDGPPLSLLPFLTEFDVAITLDSGV